MKKYRKILACISLIAMAGLTIGICSETSKADEARISSNGNFVFENGEKEVSFYADDINYIQREITALFNEMEEKRND